MQWDNKKAAAKQVNPLAPTLCAGRGTKFVCEKILIVLEKQHLKNEQSTLNAIFSAFKVVIFDLLRIIQWK